MHEVYTELTCLPNGNQHLYFAYLMLLQSGDVAFPVGMKHECINSFYFITVSYSLPEEIKKFSKVSIVFCKTIGTLFNIFSEVLHSLFSYTCPYSHLLKAELLIKLG
jgi:hypothetical protein